MFLKGQCPIRPVGDLKAQITFSVRKIRHQNTRKSPQSHDQIEGLGLLRKTLDETHNSKNLNITKRAPKIPQWGRILRTPVAMAALTRAAPGRELDRTVSLFLASTVQEGTARPHLPEVQRAEAPSSPRISSTVCSKAGSRPREVSQSQEALSHLLPPPPRGPASPRLMPRPHLFQSPAPFLHGENEGGQDEESLVTGAQHWACIWAPEPCEVSSILPPLLQVRKLEIMTSGTA